MRFAQRRQKEDKHSAVNSPPATTADKSKDLSAFLFRDCFENSPRLQKGGVNETGSFPVPRIVRSIYVPGSSALRLHLVIR